MQLSLIKCAFGRHAYGRINHDDTLGRWVRICRRCGATVYVDPPRDANGMNYTPMEWLEIQNKQSEDELTVILEKFKKES